jgi:hypothetical protein
MNTTKTRLAELDNQRQSLLAQREVEKANQKIKCLCGKMHAIKQFTAIQTHWYTSPSGCMGGDHWNTGELQLVCPTTGIKNRLLYNSYYKVPYEKRGHYDHNAEMQFNRMYKHLFKEIIDEYKERTVGQWGNNYYVDENHKKFDIAIGE